MPQIVARTPNMWTYESHKRNSDALVGVVSRVSEMCHNACGTMQFLHLQSLQLHRCCIEFTLLLAFRFFKQRLLHVISALLLSLLYQNFALLICTARSCFVVVVVGFFALRLTKVEHWSVSRFARKWNANTYTHTDTTALGCAHVA